MPAPVTSRNKVDYQPLQDPVDSRFWHGYKAAETISTRAYSAAMATLTGAAYLGTGGLWEWAGERNSQYWNDTFSYNNLAAHVTGVLDPSQAARLLAPEEKIVEDLTPKPSKRKAEKKEPLEEKKAAQEKGSDFPEISFNPVKVVNKGADFVSSAVTSGAKIGVDYAVQGKLRREVIKDTKVFKDNLIKKFDKMVTGYDRIEGTKNHFLNPVKKAAEEYAKGFEGHVVNRFNRLVDNAANESNPIEYIKRKRKDLVNSLEEDYIKGLRPVINVFLQSVQQASLKVFLKEFCDIEGKDKTPCLEAAWLGLTHSLLMDFSKSKQKLTDDINSVITFANKWADNRIHYGRPGKRLHWGEQINQLKKVEVDPLPDEVKDFVEKIIEGNDVQFDDAKGTSVQVTKIEGTGSELKKAQALGAFMVGILKGGNNLQQQEIIKLKMQVAEALKAFKPVKVENYVDIYAPFNWVADKVGQVTGPMLTFAAPILTLPLSVLGVFSKVTNTDLVSDVKEAPQNVWGMTTEMVKSFGRTSVQIASTAVAASLFGVATKIFCDASNSYLPFVDTISAMLPNDLNGAVWMSLAAGAYVQLPKRRSTVMWLAAAAYGVQYYTPWGMPNPMKFAWKGFWLSADVAHLITASPTALKVATVYGIVGCLAWNKANQVYHDVKSVAWDGAVMGGVVPAYKTARGIYRWLKPKEAF